MSAVFSDHSHDLPIDFSTDQQVAQLRVPPHSIEAESSVLGGLLLDNGRRHAKLRRLLVGRKVDGQIV